jgi:hypothetical protein
MPGYTLTDYAPSRATKEGQDDWLGLKTQGRTTRPMNVTDTSTAFAPARPPCRAQFRRPPLKVPLIMKDGHPADNRTK